MNKQEMINFLKSLNATLPDFIDYLEKQDLVSFEEVSEKLSFMDLIQSKSWPEAVDEDLMVNSEEDKIERASGIFEDNFTGMVNNKKFLDFGCGDGLVAKKALEDSPIVSVGYDPFLEKEELESENFVLTKDFEKVKKHGPFDYVLLYDVIDHLTDVDSTLKMLASVCTPNTVINVRCHPWCSRHGGHIYRKLNKAFCHLFLTNDEISKFTDEKITTVQKIITPIISYTEFFTKAGFIVVSHNVERQSVEDFFKNEPTVKEHLLKIWERRSNDEFPNFQLEMTFVDFNIKLK